VSLRTRIAAVASAAVALAVLGAAVSVYLAVRSDLRGQVDESLTRRAQDLGVGPVAAGPPPGAGARGPGGGAPLESHEPFNDGAGPARHPYPPTVAPARFGGASGYVQFVSAGGAITVPGGQGSTPEIALSGADRAIAARGVGRSLSDRTVKGTHLRVLTLGAGPPQAGFVLGGAIMIARPLAEVDRELRQVLLILLIVGVAGIAIAAALGALVARTALTPIARFTRAAETLTGRLDLSQRLPACGRDELARLARSFNATLDELERSLGAQRQLIADASHELRTPIASLRANIQTLEHAARLPADDQASLRADIIEELDELTSLVSDVVELARGSRGEASWEDVRLDLMVEDAVARTRRRGELQFELELEPTSVRGEADRMNRAVGNLLDNAHKWSPPGGLVEVTLQGGVLTVRDHGPGFKDEDLPRVFERFYRAEGARKLPGSGLGLAIVRQAAEAHHGSASAENAPGGGARLRVSFGPPLPVPAPAEPLRAH
jgi:two-component system, OmpR family, sensor histidine kinase MprB